jgi:hypothetical protein
MDEENGSSTATSPDVVIEADETTADVDENRDNSGK